MLWSDSLVLISHEPVIPPSNDITEPLKRVLKLIGSNPLILVTSGLVGSGHLVVNVELHGQGEIVDLVKEDVFALFHELGSFGVDLSSESVHSSAVCLFVLHDSSPFNLPFSTRIDSKRFFAHLEVFVCSKGLGILS